jgi:RNA polymerase sigma-70 factor (ECF subfamily)
MLDPRPESETDDKKLVLSFQTGGSGAYRDIYERYEPRVRGVCKRMLACPEDVEEACQETFLRVFQGLSRFNGRYQLGAWVCRIATNVCLDMLRAKKRRPSEPRKVEDLEHEAATPQSASDPEWSAMQRVNVEAVRSILDSLPEMHRAAIVLRDYDGLSYVDIATKLSISEKQTKALLHRARKNFRRSWTGGTLAGLLLPGGFLSKLTRLRRVPRLEEASARSGGFVSDVVGSMGNVAASCGTMVQQCGQIAVERFANSAMVIVMGTAAIGAPAIAHSMTQRHRQPAEVAVVVEGRSLDGSFGTGAEEARSPRHKKKALAEVPEESQGEGTEPAPAPAPTPQPTPTSTPTPTQTAPPSGDSGTAQPPPSGDGGSKPKDTSTQPPAPPPFVAAVGFVTEGGPAPAASAPTARSEEVNCNAQRMWQNLDVEVAGFGESYSGKLRLVVTPHAGSMQLDVATKGRSARYSSWGSQPIATWTRSDATATVELTGEYGPLYGSNPSSANLPNAGRFVAEITLDCTALSVVAQSVTYYPNQ